MFFWHQIDFCPRWAQFPGVLLRTEQFSAVSLFCSSHPLVKDPTLTFCPTRKPAPGPFSLQTRRTKAKPQEETFEQSLSELTWGGRERKPCHAAGELQCSSRAACSRAASTAKWIQMWNELSERVRNGLSCRIASLKGLLMGFRDCHLQATVRLKFLLAESFHQMTTCWWSAWKKTVTLYLSLKVSVLIHTNFVTVPGLCFGLAYTAICF